MPQTNAWVFTENNPEGAIDWDLYPNVRYAIYQHEAGDGTHTDHFQGYVEFRRSVVLATVRSILPRAHWEPRRGTRDQAREYCRKEETRLLGPWEYGEWIGGQGSRSDLISLQRSLDSGSDISEIAKSHFGTFLRYHRGIQLYTLLQSSKRTTKSLGTVVYGPTNTGKSYWCYSQSPNVYMKNASNWWDDYNGKNDCCLDDFYGWLPYHELLRLIDQYPYSVQTKGGTVNFTPKNIFITSNKKPNEWYKKHCEDMSAFDRRIERWVIMPERGVTWEFDNPIEFYSKCYELGL